MMEERRGGKAGEETGRGCISFEQSANSFYRTCFLRVELVLLVCLCI